MSLYLLLLPISHIRPPPNSAHFLARLLFNLLCTPHSAHFLARLLFNLLCKYISISVDNILACASEAVVQLTCPVSASKRGSAAVERYSLSMYSIVSEHSPITLPNEGLFQRLEQEHTSVHKVAMFQCDRTNSYQVTNGNIPTILPTSCEKFRIRNNLSFLHVPATYSIIVCTSREAFGALLCSSAQRRCFRCQCF